MSHSKETSMLEVVDDKDLAKQVANKARMEIILPWFNKNQKRLMEVDTDRIWDLIWNVKQEGGGLNLRQWIIEELSKRNINIVDISGFDPELRANAKIFNKIAVELKLTVMQAIASEQAGQTP